MKGTGKVRSDGKMRKET